MTTGNYTRQPAPGETGRKNQLASMLRQCPIPDDEILKNMGLFVNRQNMMRLLFMHELYQRILEVNGSILEFGVRWGQNLSLFSAFRGIYEPYNMSRRIIGFDTFSGFASVHEKDGPAPEGGYGVSEGYEDYLGDLLALHEQDSPISHIRKFELVAGDATETFERYLTDNPSLVVALAFFDFDLYEPTKRCLELLRGHVTKGTVICFDQLNSDTFPGETLALKEVLGLDRYAMRRSTLGTYQSYLVVE